MWKTTTNGTKPCRQQDHWEFDAFWCLRARWLEWLAKRPSERLHYQLQIVIFGWQSCAALRLAACCHHWRKRNKASKKFWSGCCWKNVSQDAAKKWLTKQALWQIYLLTPNCIPRPTFERKWLPSNAVVRVANNPVSWKAEENEPHIRFGLLKSSTLKNLSPNPENCFCVICMMAQNIASCTKSRLSLLPTPGCHCFIDDIRLWMPSSSTQCLFFCS